MVFFFVEMALDMHAIRQTKRTDIHCRHTQNRNFQERLVSAFNDHFASDMLLILFVLYVRCASPKAHFVLSALCSTGTTLCLVTSSREGRRGRARKRNNFIIERCTYFLKWKTVNIRRATMRNRNYHSIEQRQQFVYICTNTHTKSYPTIWPHYATNYIGYFPVR